MTKAIRLLYNEQGVDGYYSNNTETYKNPHSIFAIECLNNQWLFDFKSVIDLACGDGLISKHLTHNNMADTIIGCDKFMHSRYEKETGNKCLKLSFEDIANFKDELPKTDIIVISYAIDLIPKSYLQQFLFALSLSSNYLLVIRPNKHSINSPYWNEVKYFKSGKSNSFLYKKTLL